LKPKLLVPLFLISTTCIYGLYSIGERKKDVFPEQIEVSNLIVDEGDWVQGCGIIIFTVSNTTASKINQGKLVFFEQAIVSRNRQNHYRWQETPLKEVENADDSFVNGHLPGFGCAKSKVAHEYKLIVSKSIKVRESYYATSADRHLVVIPNRQLAIFEYSDQ
jgi:hypothetical protein